VADMGYFDLAKMLVAKGADVNAHAYTNKLTPLAVAVRAGHTNIAEFLREHGGHE